MNTKVDTLSEDDGDDEKQQYVAIEEDSQVSDNRTDEHHEDDDQDDARLNADNEDREELRRKRREEKAERTQRRKAAIERDKAELNFLRQQNEEMMRRLRQVEHKTASQDYRAIDSRLNDAIEEARAAEHIIAQAVEAGNGADVAKAMRIRDEAMRTVQQLEYAKSQFRAPSSQQQPQSQQQQQPQMNPMAAKLATDWMKMNSWYDPQSGDEKSKKVLEIDQSLADEGYNPNSLEYWRELDRRVETQVLTKRRGGPPVGTGRSDSPRSNRNEVYISPERKQAMIEAGVWDDPSARQRYLKAYAQWDRDNNATR